ncbi:helix-turn-helix domain-containing protein [Draconibacterium mangrovi]|uniref:helix-turn-helix domain-containing protein n=1 Tax=Draconibacterium mangrovi TaxID=2697469 RepID=UPI0013D71ED6|nr:helix-turn-helix domain-containing protein [Draconibacterium mangrovi]
MANDKKTPVDIVALQSKVWLTPEEAAKYMSLSRRQVDILRTKGTPNNGTLPFSQIGKSIFIRRTNIDKYLTEHEVKSAV